MQTEENISSLANKSASPLWFVPEKQPTHELESIIHNLRTAVYYV